MTKIEQLPLIVTDSSADMPNQYYEENDIYRISLHYTMADGTTLADIGDEAATKNLYAQLRQGQSCMTTQVNVFTFKEIFQALLQKGRPIFYLGFSSGLSGTLNSACIAAEELMKEKPGCEIVVADSLAASMGQGLLLYYLVEEARQGKTVAELKKWVEEHRLQVNHWFTVDDLNHLKRGGRISATSAALGTMLSIKPVLWVDKEGCLKPVSKERGRKKAIQALYQKLLERGEQLENKMVFISHGDCYEEIIPLKEKIQNNLPVKDVWVNYVGPVIGAHSGPGTIAVFFLGKEREK